MPNTEYLPRQTKTKTDNLKKTVNGGVLYKKAVLKTFAIVTGKHLCRSLFLIKPAFRPATLLERDSNTGAFLLGNF